MKYGFVILHYLTDKDTIKCVNSIKEACKSENYYIVIVDNSSNNGSIERVEKEVKQFENVFILKNKKNLGFAKGNNVGYRFCKESLHCDCIIISNNDIIIATHNIFEKIEKDVKEYNSAIIGPDIESLVDYGHQNPMEEQLINKKKIRESILRYRILYFLSIFNLYDFFKKIFSKDKSVNRITTKKEGKIRNVQLHGSFLIFTKIFVTKMDNAFDDNTFLYMEEAILKKICEKNQLETLYDGEIKVYHKEDSATNRLYDETNEKRKFIFRNMIRSLKVLIKYL